MEGLGGVFCGCLVRFLLCVVVLRRGGDDVGGCIGGIGEGVCDVMEGGDMDVVYGIWLLAR